MNFIENVKVGVSAAVETLSDAAQSIIAKNRINAQINRIKLVIKNENSILDKAYIQLGKYYFENCENANKDEVESLFEIVSNSKARLKMAQDIYRSILEKQNESAVSEMNPPADDFVDTITVACSNEDDYDLCKQEESIAEADSEADINVSVEIDAEADASADITVSFDDEVYENSTESASDTETADEAAEDGSEIF